MKRSASRHEHLTRRHAHTRHARLAARRHHAHHGRSHRPSTWRHTRHARLSTRTLGHVHRPEHELLRRHTHAGARNHLLLLSILTARVRARMRHTLSFLRRRRRHDALLLSFLSLREASSRTIAVPVENASHSSVNQSLASTSSDPIQPRARLDTPHASTLARTRPHARSRPRPSSGRSPLAAAIFPPNVSPPIAHVTVAEHRAPPRLRRAHTVLVALASPSRIASSRAPVVVAIVPSRTTRRRSSPSRVFGPPLSTSRCLLDGEGAGKSDERVRGRPRDRRTRRRSEDARARGRATVVARRP